MSYYSNNFRVGLKIIIDDEPYIIDHSEFIKSGKGQSFTRVKLRCLSTGTRIEKTFKVTDHVECANILDINLNYLYNDGTFWYFMDKNTFEQLAVDTKTVGDNAKWLYNQIECVVTLWNDKPIAISLPNFVELEIICTNPSIKGDTVNNNSKLATLSTGVTVKVPLFIQIGDIIKVDTRSGEYISRVK